MLGVSWRANALFCPTVTECTYPALRGPAVLLPFPTIAMIYRVKTTGTRRLMGYTIRLWALSDLLLRSMDAHGSYAILAIDLLMATHAHSLLVQPPWDEWLLRAACFVHADGDNSRLVNFSRHTRLKASLVISVVDDSFLYWPRSIRRDSCS